MSLIVEDDFGAPEVQISLNDKVVYKGKDTQYQITDLNPDTTYPIVVIASDFTSYSKERFKKYEDKDSEHKRLAENFTKLVDNGTKAILSNHNNERAWSIFVEGKKNIFVYGINITKTIGRVKGSKNSAEELLISSFEIPFLKDKRINL